jgi:hypothetical protein
MFCYRSEFVRITAITKHVIKKVGLCWLIDEKLKQPTWLNRFEYVITCLVYHKVWFFE